MSFIKKGILTLTLGAALLAPLAAAQASMRILSFTGRQYSGGLFMGYLIIWSDEQITDTSLVLPDNPTPLDPISNSTSGQYTTQVFKAVTKLGAGSSIHAVAVGNRNSAEKSATCNILGSGLYCQ
jgi:hypothetical protein